VVIFSYFEWLIVEWASGGEKNTFTGITNYVEFVFEARGG
jgi:hypothetical protein